MQNRFRKLAKIGLFPRVFGQNVSGVFVQRYVGNVTIVPRLSVFDNFRAIQHPSYSDMERYLIFGSRACFPKLDTIVHMTKVEKILQKCSDKWNKEASDKKNSRDRGSVTSPVQARPASSSVLLEGHGGIQSKMPRGTMSSPSPAIQLYHRKSPDSTYSTSPISTETDAKEELKHD